ncbi:hypothetical protein Taro_004677 [Colocasia esculenta]|uniref:Uncharacterized protein n=1 Tax=Colocasia esculenta TaxID=4460 RepID=A0A843TQS0_COLES|nr:hypothetical protein [Colocasia esculenta]
MSLALQSIPRKTRAKSFLEEEKKSGKEASASRGAEQRRQGKKKKKKEKELEIAAVLIQKKIHPRTYISCKGSVDTPTTGVDTEFQTLRQNDEEKVKCVDTASSGVDTRPSSQRTQLTGLYSVSTQPQVVSTLDPVPRGPVCQTGTMCRHSLAPRSPVLHKWDSVSTHSLVVSTHSC